MLRIFLVVTLVWTAACGGNGSIPIDELRDERLEAECAFEVRCGIVTDLESCRALFGRYYIDTGDLATMLAAGTITYDPEASADCVEQARSGS